MFSERFLQLYNDELRYFREAGRQFASSHPQVAQHLGMHIDGVLDPFVERLLEGSAFLCTRIQEKLNNEQPEFALQMLSRLAPLWYTPVPAIATVAIKPDLSFPQWHSQVDLPRGSRMTLNDISLNNKPATFTTARHIKVQPVEIALAECEILPPHHLPDGAARHMQDCSAYVRIGLTTHGVLPVSELDLEPLHLTLAEDTVRANQLMAALLNRTLRIVLWAKNDDRPVIKVLQPESLRLGGVGDEEALLPTAVGELPGNRLMREYFAAPSRFFSLELHGVRDFLRQCERVHEFEILFALEQRPLTLIGRVNARDFHLFATPVINLYRRHCSPVLLTGERTEHQLVVDRLNTSLYEIHSVKQVKGMLPDGNPVIFSSLQADVHYDCEREPAGYTLHRRREPSPSKYNNPHLPNEDTFIAISPGKSGIDIDDITSLSVEALVCERHLVPAHLQQPHFQLETAMPIHQVEIVRYPSNPVAVPNISQAWQAIQMLASNPLRHARPDVQDCSALLRDWLSLFCHQDDSSQRKRIASIKNAWVEHHFERNQGPGPLAWIRGAEIAVNLSANHHADHGAYLFGKILHHALSQYGDLNQTLSMKLLLDGETHADWGRSTMADMSLMRETALSLEQAPAPGAQGESVGQAEIRGLSNRQDFFELLRRIERAQPDAPRLGVSNDRSRERLCITQPADMGFASREIASIVQRPTQVLIQARHFGMFAPYGPLPIHVTEHARTEVIARRNQAFQQFVGIVSQRFAVLHYRAWAQLKAMIGHDHDDDKNPFLHHLRQTVGVDTTLAVNPHIQSLREAYPGIYLPGRRSLRQLNKMLAAYFAVPIEITPRYAKWIDDGKKNGSQKLGKLGSTRIGSRFFDAQYGAHIQIGPLGAPHYQQYQRGSRRLQALVSICHDFTSHQLMLDVSLLIATEPGMAAQLGGKSLSKDSWLKPKTGTFRQLVYQSTT